MKPNQPPKPLKTRQNVSLSPRVKGLFEKMADENETTMSALLTQWILEKHSEFTASQNPKPKREA